jgi:hypothetical protein
MSPSEPRGMTILDLVVLVGGVAVAFVIPKLAGGSTGSSVDSIEPLALLIVWVCILHVPMLAFAVTTVIVARRARYGGHARPAEWISLGFAALWIVDALPNLDEAVNEVLVWRTCEVPQDIGLIRWQLAGVALIVMAAVLAAIWALRARLPYSLLTLLFVLLEVVWLWGPATASTCELPWLLPYQLPFEPKWLYEVNRWLHYFAGRLPEVLVYGVPAVAAIRGLWRKDGPRWRWTEWAGATLLGILLGALLLRNLF